MKLQVLVSTMFQTNNSLLARMNIQTDAIIINQCNTNKFEAFEYLGRKIQFLSFNERGIGLSRNTALMRANGDICVFADDDVTYVDNYEDIIINEFIKKPEADMILFNVPSTNINRPTYLIPNSSRVKWYNSLRYGAVKIAVRTEKIKSANIYFSLLFGGGAKYSAGEDSLFIVECLRKGLRIYTSPQVIGYVSQRESSWFEGYNDKYFIDKGVFYACFSKRWSKLLCLQHALKHKELYRNSKSWKEAYHLMVKGIKNFKG